jgi:hypothetical protein
MKIKPSLVTVHLAMVAEDIAGCRQKMTEARVAVSSYNTALNAIPTKYANLLETVNDANYGGTNADQLANKAKLAALTAEFQALQPAVAAAQAALTSGVTEY